MDHVTDEALVKLYFDRNEDALVKTQALYGKYCHKIAKTILLRDEDAEETVNDTLMQAWRSIPPARPQRLLAFLSKITRNLALSRLDRDLRDKRRRTTDLVFDELDEVLSDHSGDIADDIALRDAISVFLKSQAKTDRVVFVKRYFYMLPVGEIAKEMALSVGAVKTRLYRLRLSLRERLEEEGIFVKE